METITKARQVVSGVYELKRNALTADLKEFTVRIFCTQSGSSFHAFRAETEQEHCWNWARQPNNADGLTRGTSHCHTS